MRIKLSREAGEEMLDAASWYDEREPGLGTEFMAEVNVAAQRLTKNPEIHRVRFADVRRAPVKRFKFHGIYYVIQSGEIWVLSVHHGRRHPRWLHERRRPLG